jgi:D-sedoheptulose 7-phosphate isomerase
MYLILLGFSMVTSTGSRTEDAPDRVRELLEESARVTGATAAEHAEGIAAGAQLLIESFRSGGKLLAFGNGGSAADAQHLTAELAGRFDRERPGLPALALTVNPSDVTAIGNDYGFAHTFARLIQAHGRSGDVAVAISTSGRAENVIAGAKEARARDLRVLALTGKGGGELAELADVAVVVPSDRTPRIQETHIAVIHALCALVDDALFPETRDT